MYANRNSHAWTTLPHILRLLLALMTGGVSQQLLGVLGHSTPLIGPEVVSMRDQPHFTLLYHPPHTTLIRQTGLPAPQGTEFEGPDPGLNAAIISAPEVCPNNYMKDAGGRCRPAFSYGPNPLSTFSPEKYKGSIQFYMGLQVGNPTQFNRRRNFLRLRKGGARRGNRLHLPKRTTPSPPTTPDTLTSTLSPPELPPALFSSLPDPVLPTPPPLIGTVAEITAILESLNRENSDAQPIDDDDD